MNSPLRHALPVIILLIIALCGYLLIKQPVTLLIDGRPLTTWLKAATPKPAPQAIPVHLHVGALNTTFYTTHPTLAQALRQQGLIVYAEDKITPPLNTPIHAGFHVYLQSAKPITLTADGQTITRRTQQATIGAALAEAGLALMGQDFTRPALEQTLTPFDFITVIRVQETVEVAETYLPFETEWQASDELELDQQGVVEPGQPGIISSRWRVRYENGQAVQRELQDEWLAQETETRHIVYGTRIVMRTLQTEHGPLEYWRKVSMLTTSYSAATSGKARNHPNYGFTRTGKQAGYGLVAVDPHVIPLKTQLYIPHYGLASAEDTGGAVLGKHIDLGFDEDTPPLWYSWHDVYLLPPIPPLYQIRYVLPEWPQGNEK